jgi:hypothetical protein
MQNKREVKGLAAIPPPGVGGVITGSVQPDAKSSCSPSNPAYRRCHVYMGYHTRRNGVNFNCEQGSNSRFGNAFTLGIGGDSLVLQGQERTDCHAKA